MQAPKELTLSVLETLVEVFRRRVPNTVTGGAERTAADLRRLRRAPGRGSLCLCLQFEASGLVVRVFVCVCVFVCSFVCVFVWLCVDACLSLFPWLVGWLFVAICACVFSGIFRYIFVLY